MVSKLATGFLTLFLCLTAQGMDDAPHAETVPVLSLDNKKSLTNIQSLKNALLDKRAAMLQKESLPTVRDLRARELGQRQSAVLTPYEYLAIKVIAGTGLLSENAAKLLVGFATLEDYRQTISTPSIDEALQAAQIPSNIHPLIKSVIYELIQIAYLNRVEPHQTIISILRLDHFPCSKAPELSRFTDFEGLSLSNNALPSLKGMSALPRLLYLCLDNNHLQSLSGIQQFTGLNTLVAKNNQLTSLAGIHFLPLLRALEVNGNELTSLEGIDQCRNLETLVVAHNQLTSLDGLEELSLLGFLDIRHNPLTSLAGIEQCHNLHLLLISSDQQNLVNSTTLPAGVLVFSEDDIEINGD